MLSYAEYLLESSDIKPVYKNKENGQFVTFTKHAWEDRNHRKWWDDVTDESFLKFVRKPLKYLSNRDRKELKFRDEWAILSKDKTKGLIVSLRYNQRTDKNDSFSIMTVLNANAKDAASDKEVFVNVDNKHKITLTENQKTYDVLCIV